MHEGINSKELSKGSLVFMEIIRPYFDLSYYLSRNPEVKLLGIDPVEHFVISGWKESRDPTPDFSTRGYLLHNPDVVAAGINPFLHYILIGKTEGRVWTSPDTGTCTEATAAEPILPDDRISREVTTIQDAFDSSFYIGNNPDVAEAAIDPVQHFVIYGWKETREPTPHFSTSGYLLHNPDVAAAGLNPFLHYILFGKTEGRVWWHPSGHCAETLINTFPLEVTVKTRRLRERPTTMLTSADLCRLVRVAASEKAAMLMLSIGHDNYRKVPGGTQLCIQHEELTARDRGIVYLNLHPYDPLPRLAHASETPDVLVSLLLAGTMIGTAPMSAVIAAVSTLAADFAQIEIVVHHLLGHSTEQVIDLVRATGHNRCRMWMHDFFALCPSYILQRNNVMFCGAPSVYSNACRLCLYGEERISHLNRIALFFKELSVHLIAPSHFTADFWQERSNLMVAKLSVCEHMELSWTKKRKNALAPDGPVTVAFIGHPSLHKGWPVFESIFHDNRNHKIPYRFVYFGTSQIEMDNVKTFPVNVTAENPDAMIRALAQEQVDIVLHWPTCPETFSFSTHEALAAGAIVITNHTSGNVAVTVQRSGLGAVLETEADLKAFFRDGGIYSMVSDNRLRRRTRQAVLTRSEMTFSILDRESQP